MSFYGSYKYEEVINMEAVQFFHLCSSMEKALAVQKICNLETVSFPHLKQDKMTKIHKSAYKKAQTDDDKEKNVIKLSDLSKVLK